jgi:hypothetical protein
MKFFLFIPFSLFKKKREKVSGLQSLRFKELAFQLLHPASQFRILFESAHALFAAKLKVDNGKGK